jgi:hypothetical protein
LASCSSVILPALTNIFPNSRDIAVALTDWI